MTKTNSDSSASTAQIDIQSAVQSMLKTASDVFCIVRYIFSGSRNLRTEIESGAISHTTVWSTKLAVSGAVGGMVTGAAIGASKRSTQFLAENAHRLPATVAGWYQYHRHKNYAVIHAAGVSGAKYGAKFGALSALFAATEQSMESVVGTERFLNATVAGLVTGSAFSVAAKLPFRSTQRALLFGGTAGLAIGLLQDAYRYLNDGRSIKKPHIEERTWSSFLDGSRWFGGSKETKPDNTQSTEQTQ